MTSYLGLVCDLVGILCIWSAKMYPVNALLALFPIAEARLSVRGIGPLTFLTLQKSGRTLDSSLAMPSTGDSSLAMSSTGD